MRLRLLPLGLLVAACAFAGTTGTTPAPWKPKHPAAPATRTTRTPIRLIDGVPDTGQFLADTTWLIRVGPRVTRVGDFVTQYLGAYPVDRPAGDSLGRVQFMKTLIHRDILGLTARALNRPLEFEDRATLRETEQRALSDVFFLRFVRDSARVSDAEVEEAQDQLRYEARFRRIVFDERPAAEQSRAALVSGSLQWNDAVKRSAPGLQGPDGDLGWVARANLWEGLGLPLFRLQPGAISEPVRTDRGYEVYQMMERRLAPPSGVNTVTAYVRRTLLAYRVSLLADSIQGLIRDRIGMVMDTANVRFAASNFNRSTEVQSEGFNTTIKITGRVPEFSPADTARVLARWKDGGRFSLGQFMAWYTGITPAARPNVTFPDALTGQVNSVVLEPYRADMARELDLDKDPEVISRVEGKREQILVEHMYQDSVASKIWVSREDRKAYYEKHKPDFITFPSVDYALILRYNRAGADSVAKAMDEGAKPWDIVAADSLRGEVTGGVHHQGQNDRGVHHKLLFEELRPGHSAVAGPDKRGIYVVVHLLRYDSGRQLSFEESQGMVDESLQNIKADERLQAMLARLAKRFEIASRPELVMRIRLIDPNER